jgi:succinoglycan biosynthesis transport protein ExoP
MLLGVAGYLFSGPDYKASTQVLVQRNKRNNPTHSERDVVVYSDRGEHIAIIKSPLILQDAIEHDKLNELSTLQGSDDLVSDLAEDLVVTRTAGGEVSLINVLDISITNKNANEAVAIVDSVARAYERWLQREHSKHSALIVEEVLKANEILEQKLQEKKEEYARFIENSPHTWNSSSVNGRPGARTSVHQVKIEDLLKRINEVEFHQLEITTRKTKLVASRAEGKSGFELEKMIQRYAAMERPTLGGNSGTAETSTPDQNLIPLLLKQKQLIEEVGANHPDLKEVQAKIDELYAIYTARGIALPPKRPDGTTATLDLNLVEVYLSSLDDRLALLDHQLEVLDLALQREILAAKKLARTAMDDETFRSDISNTKSVLDRVTLRLNEIGLNNASGYQMEVMSAGRHELNIKKPIKFIGVSMMLMAGAVMGLLCLREMKDMTVRSADDVRVRLGLPVIGGVPFYLPAGPKEMASSGFPTLHPTLCYAHKPESLEAESIRSVRTSVIVQAEAIKAKVIQITSPEPGDGKSTLVANLAIALAQSGKRVLLVEADMRRPILGNLFGSRDDIGVADVLKGEVHFRNIIQPTVFEDLSIALSGHKPGPPAELLASTIFADSLNDVRDEFDVILIDSPPLLAVADPCIIGRSTDCVLMVVRLGKNQYAYIARAQELLQTHGINLLGVIANGIFDLTDGNKYGHGYGYGDEPGNDNTKAKLPGTIGRILEPYVSA